MSPNRYEALASSQEEENDFEIVGDLEHFWQCKI